MTGVPLRFLILGIALSALVLSALGRLGGLLGSAVLISLSIRGFDRLIKKITEQLNG